MTSADDSLLTRILETHDVDCPGCGKRLRASPDDACWACDMALEVRVASSDLRLGPWTLTLLSSLLPAGFTATGVLGITMAIFDDWSSLQSELMYLAILFYLGCAAWVASVIVVIRRRHTMLSWPAGTQWRRAWMSLGINVVLISAFCLAFVYLRG